MPWITKAHLTLLEQLRARADADAATHRARADAAEVSMALGAGREDGLRGQIAVLERQNAVHQANNDWLRAQLNTITFERQQRVTLQLLERDITLTPDSEITSLPHDKRPRVDKQAEAQAQAVADALTGQAIFEDMGDDAAAALGIDWTPGGEVRHTKG